MHGEPAQLEIKVRAAFEPWTIRQSEISTARALTFDAVAKKWKKFVERKKMSGKDFCIPEESFLFFHRHSNLESWKDFRSRKFEAFLQQLKKTPKSDWVAKKFFDARFFEKEKNLDLLLLFFTILRQVALQLLTL